MKNAIFPGSFDPFTYGHLDVVKKACDMFNEVVVLICSNPDKHRKFNASVAQKAITSALHDEGITNCRVVIYNGLVAKYAKDNDIKYLIRGLRNNLDYNYEESLALANKQINPELETIYLRADKAAISSSMVRQLHMYGEDVSKFVPPAIMKEVFE